MFLALGQMSCDTVLCDVNALFCFLLIQNSPSRRILKDKQYQLYYDTLSGQPDGDIGYAPDFKYYGLR